MPGGTSDLKRQINLLIDLKAENNFGYLAFIYFFENILSKPKLLLCLVTRSDYSKIFLVINHIQETLKAI